MNLFCILLPCSFPGEIANLFIVFSNLFSFWMFVKMKMSDAINIFVEQEVKYIFTCNIIPLSEKKLTVQLHNYFTLITCSCFTRTSFFARQKQWFKYKNGWSHKENLSCSQCWKRFCWLWHLIYMTMESGGGGQQSMKSAGRTTCEKRKLMGCVSYFCPWL